MSEQLLWGIKNGDLEQVREIVEKTVIIIHFELTFLCNNDLNKFILYSVFKRRESMLMNQWMGGY